MLIFLLGVSKCHLRDIASGKRPAPGSGSDLFCFTHQIELVDGEIAEDGRGVEGRFEPEDTKGQEAALSLQWECVLVIRPMVCFCTPGDPIAPSSNRRSAHHGKSAPGDGQSDVSIQGYVSWLSVCCAGRRHEIHSIVLVVEMDWWDQHGAWAEDHLVQRRRGQKLVCQEA